MHRKTFPTFLIGTIILLTLVLILAIWMAFSTAQAFLPSLRELPTRKPSLTASPILPSTTSQAMTSLETLNILSKSTHLPTSTVYRVTKNTNHPTLILTNGPHPTDTRWPTATATITSVPTLTQTLLPTVTASNTLTATPTQTPPTPTARPTFTPSPTPPGALKTFLSTSPALCVSYYDERNARLCFVCRNKLLKWDSPQVIDDQGQVGLYSSLAFDQNQRPWIAYTDSISGDLKLASLQYEGWRIEVVDADGQTGWYPSLAFDGVGNPLIAYYDISRKAVRLAKSSNGLWDYTTVDTIGSIKEADSNDVRFPVVINSHGDVYLAYRHNDEGILKVYTNNIHQDRALILTADSQPGSGYSASLALLSDNVPVVASYNKSKRIMRVAWWNGETFDLETPDNQQKSGRFLSLVIDLYHQPTLAYFSDASDDLRFVRHTNLGWARYEVVDTFGSRGWFPSLDMDAAARISIAFYDYDARRLRVISKQDDAWLYLGGDADPATGVGLNPSLKYVP